MAFKRHVDQLPIIPKDAKQFNVVCHYCIVGCGYKAYTWPTNKQGGTTPDQNVFGVDLSKQQAAETVAWYAPAMYNVVQQNGTDVQIVIKPDHDCVVNSGLGSVRGARMAEMSYSRSQHPAPTPNGPDGVALRADAANELGRRARSGCARHRRRDQ
jgi:arsenite oxidase large subunit